MAHHPQLQPMTSLGCTQNQIIERLMTDSKQTNRISMFRYISRFRSILKFYAILISILKITCVFLPVITYILNLIYIYIKSLNLRLTLWLWRPLWLIINYLYNLYWKVLLRWLFDTKQSKVKDNCYFVSLCITLHHYLSVLDNIWRVYVGLTLFSFVIPFPSILSYKMNFLETNNVIVPNLIS